MYRSVIHSSSQHVRRAVACFSATVSPAPRLILIISIIMVVRKVNQIISNHSRARYMSRTSRLYRRRLTSSSLEIGLVSSFSASDEDMQRLLAASGNHLSLNCVERTDKTQLTVRIWETSLEEPEYVFLMTTLEPTRHQCSTVGPSEATAGIPSRNLSTSLWCRHFFEICQATHENTYQGLGDSSLTGSVFKPAEFVFHSTLRTCSGGMYLAACDILHAKSESRVEGAAHSLLDGLSTSTLTSSHDE